MLKRILGVLLGGLLWVATPAYSSIANDTSPLGMNLTSPLRYAMDLPYINEMKRAEVITQSSSAWSTGELDRLAYDNNGWPQSLAAEDGGSVNLERVSYLLFGGDYTEWKVPAPEGCVFTVMYEGEGTLVYSGGAQLTGSCGTGCDLVQMTPANGIVIISIVATDPNDTGDHLRNIQVLHPGGICNGDAYQWFADDTSCPGSFSSLVSLRDSHIFHPDYLASLKHYRSLRFMNSTFTNHLPIPSWSGQAEMLAMPLREWADRPKEADSVWSSEDKGGLPIEIMVELANELDIAPWFTMPVYASEGYLTGFAQQVKQELRSDQIVYIEFGNEIWNGSFGTGTWVHYQANEF